MVRGRFADFQEFCFQAAKRSDMNCEELQLSLLAYWQEWHFQASKRSDKSNTILQGCRFADAEE